MALSDFHKSLFSEAAATKKYSEDVIRTLWLDKLEEIERKERKAAQRLLDWYNRDTASITMHLIEAARKSFDATELKSWQWPLINGVPRLIKRISLTYKEAPERKLYRGRGQGRKEVEPNDPQYEAVFGEDGLFKNIDMTQKLKEMDRYSTLFNTLHTEVVPRGGAVDWDIHLRPQTIAVPSPDDFLKFSKIAFAYSAINPDNLIPSAGWIYWTDELYALRLENKEWVGVENEEGINPYGTIPVVVVRKVEQDDYWGAYGENIVDGFEKMNIQFAQTWETAIMQTFGVPLGINLGFKKGETMRIGPRKPLSVEDVDKDMATPTLSFAKPENDIDKLTDLVNFYLNSLGNSEGLPAGAWSIDKVPESGFAKFMNNIELLENREDGLKMWSSVEKELFEKSKIVHNYYADYWGETPIDDDIYLDVNFGEVKFPESPGEKIERYAKAKAAGLTSSVRYYMQEKGISRDEAIELVKKIQKERDLELPSFTDADKVSIPGTPNDFSKGTKEE